MGTVPPLTTHRNVMYLLVICYIAMENHHL
jgi:hypothetical protein